MLRNLLCISIVTGLMLSAVAAKAATEQDAQKALAAAQSADKQAAAHKNRWTTAEKAFKAAKKAADAKNYDEAVKLANEAEALNKAAVAQSVREDKDWRQAVIR